MREVSKMSFSCEERRLGWLSELLERSSEEVTKYRTSGVRTFLVQFRTNSAALAENSPSEKARILREIASQIQNGVRSGRISDGSGRPNWRLELGLSPSFSPVGLDFPGTGIARK